MSIMRVDPIGHCLVQDLANNDAVTSTGWASLHVQNLWSGHYVKTGPAQVCMHLTGSQQP